MLPHLRADLRSLVENLDFLEVSAVRREVTLAFRFVTRSLEVTVIIRELH
jgi:hypothetical protein